MSWCMDGVVRLDWTNQLFPELRAFLGDEAVRLREILQAGVSVHALARSHDRDKTLRMLRPHLGSVDSTCKRKLCLGRTYRSQEW